MPGISHKARLRCPYCQSNKVIVKDVRLRKENTIRRIRVCHQCKGSWQTVEIDIIDYEDMELLKQSVKDITSFSTKIENMYGRKLKTLGLSDK